MAMVRRSQILGCVWNMEMIEFPDALNMGCEKKSKDGLIHFGQSNWTLELPFIEEGMWESLCN